LSGAELNSKRRPHLTDVWKQRPRFYDGIDRIRTHGHRLFSTADSRRSPPPWRCGHGHRGNDSDSTAARFVDGGPRNIFAPVLHCQSCASRSFACNGIAAGESTWMNCAFRESTGWDDWRPFATPKRRCRTARATRRTSWRQRDSHERVVSIDRLRGRVVNGVSGLRCRQALAGKLKAWERENCLGKVVYFP